MDKNIRQQTLDYLTQWENTGGRTGRYICPVCGANVFTTLPSDNQIWSSMCTCYECNDIHFLIRKFSGVTVKNQK